MAITLDEAEIQEFLAGAHTAIVATLRRDGSPLALPVWFVMLDGSPYIRTMARTLESCMSSAATLRMSDAVDTDWALIPLASAKWEWSMPNRRAVAFIFATKAGMLPASQRAKRSA